MKIRFSASGKVVARPRVRSSGLFRATAKLPPREAARHQPRPLPRRDRQGEEPAAEARAADARLEHDREGAPRHDRGARSCARSASRSATVIVKRRLSCGSYRVVKRFKPRASGGVPRHARRAAEQPGGRLPAPDARAQVHHQPEAVPHVHAAEVRRPRAVARCGVGMRRTKIVATIGPASRDPEVLVRMVEAGMDVARLNFSHGSAEEHAETASLVRQAAGRAGRQVAVLQDLPGPKLRIGPLTRRDRRAQARRRRDVRLRRERRRRRRAPDVHHVGRAGRHRRAPAR